MPFKVLKSIQNSLQNGYNFSKELQIYTERASPAIKW